MIIKEADSKDKQLHYLQQLFENPTLNSSTKTKIEKEIRIIRAGIRGEEEAAYEMKVHFGASANWMVIHDLRLEIDGLVAQIDHLIMNRLLEIWVCESKHFSEGITINEHGEFMAYSGNKAYGIPSPIAQNERHIVVLKRLFETGLVNLPSRLGFKLKPDLRSLILVSKRAKINRPKRTITSIDQVIKNDMIFKTIEKSFNDANPLTMAKIIGGDTLALLAQNIATLHKPIEINWLAKFGIASLQDEKINEISKDTDLQSNNPISENLKKNPENESGQVEKKKLICHTCSDPIPFHVAKFCWFNKKKFAGNIYCLACQKCF